MDRNVIKVDILPEDFRDAPHGYSLPRCPLANALQRMYPNTYIYVDHVKAVIGSLPKQAKYRIDLLDSWGGVKAQWPADKITEISVKAKESLEGIPTVSLTLEPY